ncbi:uncharacterized protein LOC121590636 [Anopheles merus]|nr:uncharacterized protein LOC121590636 [Anopheles merus]
MKAVHLLGILAMVSVGRASLLIPDRFNMTGDEMDRTNEPVHQSAGGPVWQDTEHGKVLSRRKRFIVFPEGSSFSVAVCMTIGLYGNPNYQFVSWALNWGIAYNLPNQTLSFQKEMTEPKPMVQRRFRRDLYQKLEVIMDSMGYDGRDCILRALCESSQYFGGKGQNMVAEMLRTLFSYPKQKVLSFEHADHRLYDEAHRKGRNMAPCQSLYGNCQFSLLELALGKYSTPRNSQCQRSNMMRNVTCGVAKKRQRIKLPSAVLLWGLFALLPCLSSSTAGVYGGADDGGGTAAAAAIAQDASAPQRILSRKRRFLTFPEGSSFQVVYDQTIPMIGVERLFTIGITVALAYELPSITFNQIEEMLRENGAYDKLDLNANNTILDDGSKPSSTPARKNIFDYYYQTPGRPAGNVPGRINYYTAPDRRYDTLDRYGQRLPSWDRFVSNRLPHPPYADSAGNDFGSIVNRYLQGWIRRHPPNYPMAKKRFYPVFGKRSIREDTAPLDRHFLNHHRTTRHTLYEQIEQFLTAKGKHGHHCVLRALCESGQRKDDTEPDTFLKEILRAIFSLPATHEPPAQHKHRLYDEAHAHAGNCSETYSYCEDSFWSSNFVF